MGIEARCRQCGADYLLADHLAGKTVRCKQCGQPFQVPVRLDELEVVEAPPSSLPPDAQLLGMPDDLPPELQLPRRDIEPEVEALLTPNDQLELTQLETMTDPNDLPPPADYPIAFDIFDIAGPSGRGRTWFLVILAISILCLVHPLSAKYAMWAMLVIGGIWTFSGMIFWIKEAFRWGYEPVKLFIPFHPVVWTVQHVRLVPDSTAAVLRGLVLLLMSLPLYLVAQTAT